MIPLWTLVIIMQINGQPQQLEVHGFVSAQACHLAAQRIEKDPPRAAKIRCVQE